MTVPSGVSTVLSVDMYEDYRKQENEMIPLGSHHGETRIYITSITSEIPHVTYIGWWWNLSSSISFYMPNS